MVSPTPGTLWASFADPESQTEAEYRQIAAEFLRRGVDLQAGDLPDENKRAKALRTTKALASYTDRDLFYAMRETQGLVNTVCYAHMQDTIALTSPLACVQSCKMCPGQYRSLAVQRCSPDKGYHRTCSDAEATTSIYNDVAVTDLNLAKLRQMITEHGDTVAVRWQKRSKTKPSDLVRAAMPDICPSKWLEAIADKQISPRKCWLLPYLDVENICEKDRLVQLILARVRSDAKQHLAYDLERTDMAFERWHVKILFNAHAVTMCEEAGPIAELWQYDHEQVHRGDTVGFPRAQLADRRDVLP
ncbi:hypothetical protein LTR49_025900 [Elasticomyces elasticus]|nr:hypothetical protein LTR49_025900 [Elasticomyces elasticus]KAK5738739.1 hypothetical protein LTS12_025494 [Elasticomyces elasticus]